MLKLGLRERFDDIASDIGVFGRDELQRGLARTLNEAARGAVTDASKKIRERFPTLKLKDVNPAFSLQPASADSLIATVTVKGRPLSLMRFFDGSETARGKGGVFVNVKGQRKFFPHAWVQTLKTNRGDDYQVLMVRVGKERYPVEVLKTIDIPGAFGLPDVSEYVVQQTDVRFDKAATRYLTYLESKQ